MGDYLKLIEQFELSRGIVTAGLLMSRILGMIWLAPFLGGKLVPNQVKIGVALAVGVLLYPAVASSGDFDLLYTGKSIYPFGLRLGGYVLKEVFIGVLLGFIIMTIWYAAEMAGSFVDTARGSSMGKALVPQMGSQVSQLASLYYQLLIIIFLAIDGHLLFIGIFAESYQLIPVISIPNINTEMWPFFDNVIRLTANLFLISLKLAAPVMIAIFVTDVCMGLFNKVAPQINVLFLMMPFKAILGVLFSMLALYLFVQKSEEMMYFLLDQLRSGIHQLKP